MNKTIKEQAEAYYTGYKMGDEKMIEFIERIITEERKRRLPKLDELGRKLIKWSNDGTFHVSDFRNWLLSCESEAVVEDEVKVVNPTAFEMNDFLGELNRVLLAEKIMIRNSNVFFDIEDYRCDDLVQGSFSLADEFIKQAKG